MDENRAGVKLPSHRLMKVVEIKLPTERCANHHGIYGMLFVRVVAAGEQLC